MCLLAIDIVRQSMLLLRSRSFPCVRVRTDASPKPHKGHRRSHHRRPRCLGRSPRKHHGIDANASDTPSSPSPRDDDVLPDNLADSLLQASEATVAAMNRGATKCIIELLIPEFWDPLSGPVFSDEGDNLRFWKLSRRILDNLHELLPSTNIKALFPDMGVTAMLQNFWSDAEFEIGSIASRVPVTEGDEVVVLAAPDPQCFDDCQRIVDAISDDCTVIMFNPRLASGDVGVGLNIRRLRERFLSSFVTTYSLRPIGDIGTVFRKFPEQWKVFLPDEKTTGRHKLVAERSLRPAGDALDAVLQEAKKDFKSGSDNDPSSFVDSVALPIRSLQRFMKSLM